jgi:hypothetical protein
MLSHLLVHSVQKSIPKLWILNGSVRQWEEFGDDNSCGFSFKTRQVVSRIVVTTLIEVVDLEDCKRLAST